MADLTDFWSFIASKSGSVGNKSFSARRLRAGPLCWQQGEPHGGIFCRKFGRKMGVLSRNNWLISWANFMSHQKLKMKTLLKLLKAISCSKWLFFLFIYTASSSPVEIVLFVILFCNIGKNWNEMTPSQSANCKPSKDLRDTFYSVWRDDCHVTIHVTTVTIHVTTWQHSI